MAGPAPRPAVAAGGSTPAGTLASRYNETAQALHELLDAIPIGRTAR
jgi:hypothetical protein